jgi:type I restriction enzyme M protein
MFEQTFKNIDDVLWKDAGCTSELDYSEQTSWLLFLKYLDSLEHEKADVAALEGRKYTHILEAPYRWSSWAAPRLSGDGSGKIDHNKALTGDDLRDFVNQKLLPYLHGFKERATGPGTIENKIGGIVSPKSRVEELYGVFAAEQAAIVMNDGKIVAVLSEIDLIEHLARHDQHAHA